MPAMPKCADDRGASAAEYTLLAAAIAAVMVAILFALGQHVYRVYDDSCDHIGTTAAAGEC